MKPRSERVLLAGPVGRIEAAIDHPGMQPRGWALVGHPHPLFGGTADNKVVTTLSRAFLALGWIAVRPNFRGVGASEGAHDEGRGETDDFLYLAQAVPKLPQCAGLPAEAALPALAGFSFGSFVAACAAQRLAARGRPARALVLVGTAAGKWAVPPADPASIVIHGEADETVPLAAVLDWARPGGVPVIVLPGADHFFHRRLAQLKEIVVRNLVGAARAGAAGAGGGGD
jgi:hypothetical protein